MAAMTKGTEIRTEDFTSGGGDPTRIFYFYDPAAGSWVSTHSEKFQFGRNYYAVGTEYMRSVNGIVPTSTHGPNCVHDFKVISLVASHIFPITPSQVALQIFNNGSQIGSDIPWEGSNNLTQTLDIDGDAGNLSLHLTSTGGSPAYPWFPIYHIEVRWRL